MELFPAGWTVENFRRALVSNFAEADATHRLSVVYRVLCGTVPGAIGTERVVVLKQVSGPVQAGEVSLFPASRVAATDVSAPLLAHTASLQGREGAREGGR